VFSLLALLCAASPVGATIFTVLNTNDSGAGSLRAQVLAANANAGLDQIVFNAGVTGTISLATTIDITDDLTLIGPGARVVTVSGGNARRIFNVTAPASISRLRMANGFTDRGAAIAYNAAGLLSVSDCHFDQNTVTIDGGAILLFQGSLLAERCTFTTDQAAGNGGVIWYGQGGGTPTATIRNCTFVNNFASNAGGAIRQFNTTAYTAAVTNCTFVVNNAGNNGGAIALAGGTMTLLNNLFTANAAGGNPGGHLRENGGTFVSLGHNLFGHLDGTTFVPDPSDRFGSVASQLNTGVLIAFPFNNGGLTDTLPLLATSIGIDAGGTTGAPSSDQRDFPRIGCSPDVGAFEVQTLTDTDADGVLNCLDTCPATPTCASVDQTGCPTDADADGVADGCDQCPGTLASEAVDANGCASADEDGDGVLNDADECRGTELCATAGVDAAGCPTDLDADGVSDGCDRCPDADDLADANGDGVFDCLASGTTTTTLPACQSDTDCDDGDACTADVCGSAGCQNLAPAGLAGADCLLSAAIAQPVCAAGTIDPKLTQFANKKLQRALDNLRKAAQATKAKQQQKLIDKAGGLLGKILRRELGTTSDGCLQLLTAQVDEVLDTLPRR
jgi:hypothetical protein